MTKGTAPSASKPPAYVAPKVVVMDEEQILNGFQVTSAQTGWWVMAGGSM